MSRQDSEPIGDVVEPPVADNALRPAIDTEQRMCREVRPSAETESTGGILPETVLPPVVFRGGIAVSRGDIEMVRNGIATGPASDGIATGPASDGIATGPWESEPVFPAVTEALAGVLS